MSFSRQVGQERGEQVELEDPPVTFTRSPAIHVRCYREGLRHFPGLLLSCCESGSCGEDGTEEAAGE